MTGGSVLLSSRAYLTRDSMLSLAWLTLSLLSLASPHFLKPSNSQVNSKSISTLGTCHRTPMSSQRSFLEVLTRPASTNPTSTGTTLSRSCFGPSSSMTSKSTASQRVSAQEKELTAPSVLIQAPLFWLSRKKQWDNSRHSMEVQQTAQKRICFSSPTWPTWSTASTTTCHPITGSSVRPTERAKKEASVKASFQI